MARDTTSETTHDFSLGIEEEYLLIDPETCALAPAPAGMMEACSEALDTQFSPEFKACQVEIGTQVCKDVAAARSDLRHLRQTVKDTAADFGLAPIAVSCHPFADWKDQHHTDKDRYNDLEQALAGVARRMLISGMHVHVGIADTETRIDLLNQLSYFLPHLLSLSTSSPYWQGEDTGLSSYRLTVFDNLPRTGLPPRFESWSAYQRTVEVLVELELIEDTTKIWWDLRPSYKFPTIEARIFDVQPRLEDTLTLAALTQCISRMLWRLKERNQRWRLYDPFLLSENRWRAQRFGANEPLIDLGRKTLVPVADLVEELLDMIEQDTHALDCWEEAKGARRLATEGTSSDRQRRVYAAERETGTSHQDALNAVVRHLAEEFAADL